LSCNQRDPFLFLSYPKRSEEEDENEEEEEED
jgi:hypothetical protein